MAQQQQRRSARAECAGRGQSARRRRLDTVLSGRRIYQRPDLDNAFSTKFFPKVGGPARQPTAPTRSSPATCTTRRGTPHLGVVIHRGHPGVSRPTTTRSPEESMTRQNSLAVIIVSHNSAGWLAPCLSSVYTRVREPQAGRRRRRQRFDRRHGRSRPARLSRRSSAPTENRGFAAANNRGLEIVDAEWVLFLNPDTESSRGRSRSSSPRFEHADGRARRSQAARRERRHGPDDAAIPECHSLSLHEPRRRTTPIPRLLARRTGARGALYDRETPCDWTSRRVHARPQGALDDVGGMDERFFLYSEETDLCLRIRQAGWNVIHFPQMTILHESSGTSDGAERADGIRTAAIHGEAFRRRRPSGGIARRPRVRASLHQARRGPDARRRRSASRSALTTLLGLTPPPFGDPSTGLVRPRRGRRRASGRVRLRLETPADTRFSCATSRVVLCSKGRTPCATGCGRPAARTSLCSRGGSRRE